MSEAPIVEEQWFMPQRVWIEKTPNGDVVRVSVRGSTHRVVSALRLVHGRFEPLRELQTLNENTQRLHLWQPMPFPAQKP